MFHQNKIIIGLLVGLILPVIGFGLLFALFEFLDRAGAVSNIGLSEDFRLRTIGIVAIGLNAIALNAFYKRRATQSMRGIVIITFVYVVAWVIYFGDKVL
ncbi:MAG: hypothetical protein AAF849_19205 [Bacteroidota bacterium]